MAIEPPWAPPSEAPPPEVVGFLRTATTPVGLLDGPIGDDEAHAIARVIGDSRVIALGEPGHGAEEPLLYRNRLIRHLVEQQGLTAIALESGIAETRRVGDYVLGGPGDPAELVKAQLSWNFGDFLANLELIVWLRDWNADPHRHRVRLYGIDISGGDRSNSLGRARIALDDVAAYLARTAPDASTALRAMFTEFAPRFTPELFADIGELDRGRLSSALSEAKRVLAAERTSMIATTSADAHSWASEIAEDAERLVGVFRVWPTGADLLPMYVQQFQARDLAQADHLQWLLAREGDRGRILVFQSNAHVSVMPLRFGAWRWYPLLPTTLGGRLRRRLGADGYRTILIVSSDGRSADDTAIGSLDRAFAATGESRLWLDMRETESGGWWSRDQSILTNRRLVNDLNLPAATDAFVYLDRLTDTRTQ